MSQTAVTGAPTSLKTPASRRPRPPAPMSPTRICSLAPATRAADAAVVARKALRFTVLPPEEFFDGSHLALGLLGEVAGGRSIAGVQCGFAAFEERRRQTGGFGDVRPQTQSGSGLGAP